jgi:hypothetical protein
MGDGEGTLGHWGWQQNPTRDGNKTLLGMKDVSKHNKVLGRTSNMILG